MNASPAKTPHNRVALVTGAGSGIGAACAQAAPMPEPAPVTSATRL